jgi:inner membrane protein
MDNLTHTLIGLSVGEALARATPVSKHGLARETRRGMLLAATMIGGNLPDLDLLYSYRGPSTDKLTYMLEHRGYTHTIVGCLLLALLLYGGIEAWLYRHRLAASRTDHVALLCVALFGTGLHLGMDALNSYGIHPFWPVQNRWIYGDSVYIVEPLYWAATAPLIFLLSSTIARILLGLVLLAAVVASIVSGLVPRAIYESLIGFIGLMLWIGWRGQVRTAALASAAAVIVLTVSFIVAGHIAARRVESMASAEFPAARMIDDVLTPMPEDPLCWDVLVLQTTGDRYISRRATLALAPALIPANRCGGFSIDRRTLPPQTEAAVRDAAAIRWREFSMSRAALAALVASHCDAAALMRFARAPFAITAGKQWLMGDLRFASGSKPGFADIRIGEHATGRRHCPWIPPWEPPRAELFESASLH